MSRVLVIEEEQWELLKKVLLTVSLDELVEDYDETLNEFFKLYSTINNAKESQDFVDKMFAQMYEREGITKPPPATPIQRWGV